MQNIKYIVVVILVMLLLAACEPTDISTPIKPTELLSPSPEPTKTNLPPEKSIPPIPTNTPTPISLIPAPAGIVYQTETELWRVKKDGKPQLIYQFLKGDRVIFSPSNTHIFHLEYATTGESKVNQYIVDLSTLNKILIYPRDNLNTCLFAWMPEQPEIIYTVLLPDDTDPGYSCERGSPVFLSTDGSDLIILDKEVSGWSSPSVSPNGKYVAFDKQGEPWLYKWDEVPFPFDIEKYNFIPISESYFLSPSWSPDSNRLAWIVVQDTGGTEQREIIIFDIRENTFITLAPCQLQSNTPCGLSEFEGKPQINWSGDGNYISIINHSLDSYGVYSLNGQSENMFKDGFYAIEWNPFNSWYARIEASKTCLDVFVETADGKESHQVGCGRKLVWSPDGNTLVFGEKEYGWWLVNIRDWSVSQLDIPQDSEIINWIDFPSE